MTSEIVPTQTLIPGVELIYLEDRDVAGIHIRGLAEFLKCSIETLSDAINAVESTVYEVRILDIKTQIEMSKCFLCENSFIDVLEELRKNSRHSSTRLLADSLLDEFVRLGMNPMSQALLAPAKSKVQKAAKVKRKDFLYVITDSSGFCKIGRSRFPEKRLAQLQTACSDQLSIVIKLKGKGSMEKRIHSLLADFRTRGEWFDLGCLQVLDWETL